MNSITTTTAAATPMPRKESATCPLDRSWSQSSSHIGGEQDPHQQALDSGSSSRNKKSNSKTIENGNQDQDQEEEDVSMLYDLESSGDVTFPTAGPPTPLLDNDETSLARSETKAVRSLRLVLFLVLVVSAIGVALGVHAYVQTKEQTEFQAEFQDHAVKVLASLGTGLESTLAAVDTFSAALIAHAKATHQQWPFVTMDDYCIVGSKIRSLSKAVVINTYPLVQDDQRIAWQNYTRHHNQWVEDSLAYQRHHDPAIAEKVALDYVTWDVIYGYDEYEKDDAGQFGTNRTGPYLPVWQMTPVITHTDAPTYNWDLLSSVDIRSIQAVFDTHLVSLTEAYLIAEPDDLELQAENEYNAEWFRDYLPPGQDPLEPVSDIYYPIHVDKNNRENRKLIYSADNNNNTNSTSTAHSDDSQLVGLLALSVYWRDFLKNILPTDSNGILVVLSSGCNPTFTYQIDGPAVHFLGTGDYHNAAYDSLVVDSPVNDLRQFAIQDSTYAGIPMNRDYCPFTVRVYPSDEMRQAYTSSDALVLPLVVALIFAFTSAVFIYYDTCVERRQRIVLTTALQSTTNVKWLETKVQERTQELERTNRRLEMANRAVQAASSAQLQHFACMSHELRTGTNLDAMQKESIDMIVASGDLLLSIINDVLDYSKLETGNVEIEIKRTNLQETMDVVVWTVQTRAQSRNLSLATNYDWRLPEFIKTDSWRLQQILYNLLGNAVKFSKDGGVVELDVMAIDWPERSLGANAYSPPTMAQHKSTAGSMQPTKVLRLEVKDYGKGIARKNFEKIFLPFLQESTATECIYGGSGLGLSITSKLVHRLGGTINVESEEGMWSKFTVDLPLDNDCLLDPKSVVSPELKSSTIVLVSNNDGTLGYVARLCGNYNLSFTGVASMDDLARKLQAGSGDGIRAERPFFICLVDEDLYNDEIFSRFYDSLSINPLLISFGPHFKVKESRGHYRSLIQVLPCVLMKSLGEYIQLTAQDASTDANSECVEKPCPDLQPMQMAPIHQASLLGSCSNTAARISTTTPSGADPGSVPYGELQVLIAEDNIVNQKVLSRILNRLGVDNVEIVDNGRKAVDREAKEAFDVVLMDMQMPVMGGVEACRLITSRDSSDHPKPMIIFITAHAMETFATECFEAGATDFLSKPCNVSSVDLCFQRVFGRKEVLRLSHTPVEC